MNIFCILLRVLASTLWFTSVINKGSFDGVKQNPTQEQIEYRSTDLQFSSEYE